MGSSDELFGIRFYFVAITIFCQTPAFAKLYKNMPISLTSLPLIVGNVGGAAAKLSRAQISYSSLKPPKGLERGPQRALNSPQKNYDSVKANILYHMAISRLFARRILLFSRLFSRHDKLATKRREELQIFVWAYEGWGAYEGWRPKKAAKS